MSKKIILLITLSLMMIVHVEASIVVYDVTKAQVLAGTTPYKEVEVVKVKNGFQVSIVIKSMIPVESVTFLLLDNHDLSPEEASGEETGTIMSITSKNEFIVSFFIKKEDISTRQCSVTLTPSYISEDGVARRMLINDSVYALDNLSDYITVEK